MLYLILAASVVVIVGMNLSFKSLTKRLERRLELETSAIQNRPWVNLLLIGYDDMMKVSPLHIVMAADLPFSGTFFICRVLNRRFLSYEQAT